MESGICGIGDVSCGCNCQHSFGGCYENDVLVPNLVECDSGTDTYQGDKTLDYTLCTGECGVFLAVSMRTLRTCHHCLPKLFNP